MQGAYKKGQRLDHDTKLEASLRVPRQYRCHYHGAQVQPVMHTDRGRCDFSTFHKEELFGVLLTSKNMMGLGVRETSVSVR